MKYNKPFDATDLDAPYVNGNPAIGVKGSIPPAEAFEYPQREIMHVIEAAGMTGTNTDLFQLLKAIKFFGGNVKQGVDAGTKNAIVVDLDLAPTSYDKLFCLVQKMATSNDAAMTFNANSLGVKPLKDATGANLSSGALVGNGVFLAMYDGTQMRVVGGTTSYTSISGLTASGGEAIDVDTSAVVSVNFDKPAYSATIVDTDIFLRKLSGGAHKKFNFSDLKLALPKSLIAIQTFTSNGTYTPTTGARAALAFVTGAGGGSAGGNNGSGAAGAGAGATAIKLLNLVGFSPAAVTVGAGGSLGTGAGHGTQGGQSSLGTLAIAGGGSPPTDPGGGFTNQLAGDGGVATAGDILLKGGEGQTVTINGYGVCGGQGGASFWGGGGAGSKILNAGFFYNPQGMPGCAPGSGAGGGSAGSGYTSSGNVGADGIVVILEFA